MADMLVRLYDLPPLAPAIEAAGARGVIVRQMLPMHKTAVLAWVQSHFPSWVAEVEVAFGTTPVSCFGAWAGEQLLGFAAWDVTCRNFFGPMGVSPEARNSGIGRALLLSALHAQRGQGYAYAVIGGVGPAHYYEHTVGAQVIEHSTPGIYGVPGMPRRERD